MAKLVLNNPSPNVLMNSMRSIGYSFKTAVADIIDNSISANASEIRIYTPINSNNLFVAILDNGEGMNREELFNAMRYGSTREYKDSDLGKFGLGLKSASLSQCRKLTVASKKTNEISAFSWDLDSILDSKSRDCLELEQNEIDNLPFINILKERETGTLVLWEKFDIYYKKSNGNVYEILSQEVEDTEHHISLIFHRFLNNKRKPLKIYINDDEVIGCDPFLEDHPKTDSEKPSKFEFAGSTISVQPFILPHMNDLTNEDIEHMGGNTLLRNGQGFYIYRNDRLIIYGTWFRLASTNILPELFKYGRIKVDIPNTLDEEWDIDIKKQNANIPKALSNNLKKVVSSVRTKSKAKSEKRAKLTLEQDNNKIWNKGLNRDNKEFFFINNNSQFIKNFIDDFDDNNKSKILHLIDVISNSLPYDDIYNSMCNRAISRNIEQERLDSIVIEGINQFKWLKQMIKKSDEEIFKILKTYEPFDDEDILNLVKVRINNDG